LTQQVAPANTNRMAYSFLVFDFGTNEEVAQQARHRIEGWKQGFRLDKKLQLKFDRKEAEATTDTSSKPPKNASKTKPASKGKSKSGDGSGEVTDPEAATPDIRMIVRLDFSDHEKLSHQRWLDRIPGEEPFKASKPKIVRMTDPEFDATSELFDSLD
jgi:hypothetical protein